MEYDPHRTNAIAMWVVLLGCLFVLGAAGFGNVEKGKTDMCDYWDCKPSKNDLKHWFEDPSHD